MSRICMEPSHRYIVQLHLILRLEFWGSCSLWSLEGIFDTSEDTRLSNPDTWTFWYLLKFLPFVNHIRNRYHSTAIYNCNPLFELAFLTTYRSLRCFYQVLIYRVIYMALIHYKYKIILYIPLNEISESQITLTPFTVSSCPKLITYKMSFCSSTKSSYMFASFSWVKFTHLS